MPVDFFNASCLTVFSASKVGISDANAGSNSPAFVKYRDEDTWDFTVNNPNNRNVEYRAIDYCIDVFRTSNYDVKDEYADPSTFSSASTGDYLIKRCEGFLFRENEFIVFFEIKTKLNQGWFTDASRKFEETILSFKEHHPNMIHLVKNPIVSNKACEKGVHQNEMIQNKILKDKTGLNIRVEISTNYDVA